MEKSRYPFHHENAEPGSRAAHQMRVWTGVPAPLSRIGSLPGRVLISETRDKKPECPSGIPGFWPGQNQGHLQLLGTDKKESATFWVVRVLHPLTRSCLLSSCCWSVRLLSCTCLSCMLTGWVNAFSKSNLSDSPQQESTLLSILLLNKYPWRRGTGRVSPAFRLSQCSKKVQR